MPVKDKSSSSEKSLKDNQKQSSQFGLGLLMGFFAGLSSYFLFKSEEGEQLRSRFQEKWQEATGEIPSITELKIGDMQLSELIGILLGTKMVKTKQGAGLKIKNTSRRVSREKLSSPQKFTGV